MDIWQVGVLLIGIGVLFFSVYLGMVFKETSYAIKDVRRIVDRNSREIENIIMDTSQILSSINTVSGFVSGVAGSNVATGVVKTGLSIAQKRRKRQEKEGSNR